MIDQIKYQMKTLVVTERGPEETWLLNLGVYNDETDVEISEEIGQEILRLQAMDFRNITCRFCLNHYWICEQHPDKPWAGVVGDVLGCQPDCEGPGMLCDHQTIKGDTE